MDGTVMEQPPTIYDIAIDARRPVTQQDVDSLLRVADAWGTLCRQFDQERDRVRAALATSSELGHG